jgi:hypothetical protein
MEDLLRERLMRRLRSGPVKAVYSVGAYTEVRGPAAYFAIVADMNARHEERVRDAIEYELQRLRTAERDTAFYADRDALSRSLRLEYSAPGALRNWAMNRLHRTDLYDDFPDVGEYYATVGPDSIAAFARRLFVADNRSVHIRRPLPLHPAWVVVLAGVIIMAGIRAYRRCTLRPADMTSIRYIAHLRRRIRCGLPRVSPLLSQRLVLLRLLAAVVHFAAEYWLLPTGSFALLLAGAATLLFGLTLGTITGVGMLQTKILVFDDEVRIKSPTYRATIIPAADVRGGRSVTEGGSLRLRRPAPGAGRGAVFLELVDGTGYLLDVRDSAALVQAIESLLQRNPSAALPVIEVPDEAVNGDYLTAAVTGVAEHDG